MMCECVPCLGKHVCLQIEWFAVVYLLSQISKLQAPNRPPASAACTTGFLLSPAWSLGPRCPVAMVSGENRPPGMGGFPARRPLCPHVAFPVHTQAPLVPPSLCEHTALSDGGPAVLTSLNLNCLPEAHLQDRPTGPGPRTNWGQERGTSAHPGLRCFSV